MPLHTPPSCCIPTLLPTRPSHTPCLPPHRCREFVTKLLSYQDGYAYWAACEFSVKPAPGLHLTNATIDAALAALAPRAANLDPSPTLIFSGTSDAGLLYGAVVFNNITSLQPVKLAKQVCATVAAKLDGTLPHQYFAQTKAVAHPRFLNGLYDPTNPEGLSEPYLQIHALGVQTLHRCINWYSLVMSGPPPLTTTTRSLHCRFGGLQFFVYQATRQNQ